MLGFTRFWGPVARTIITIVLLTLGVGCAKTVRVSVPAHPAVPLDHDRFSVVAVDRSCQGVADGLTHALAHLDGVSVDPSAPARLEVLTCGRTVVPVVDIELADHEDRRRVGLEGRAHAVVAVNVASQGVAHIIGTGQRSSVGAWGETDVSGLSRAMQRDLDDALAHDLTRQIDPLPRQVSRRIHPNASDGSARNLHTRAVLAEQRGDFIEARSFARRARDADPSPRYVDYLQELDRLVAALEDAE
jgi:hypothetical protein